MVSFTNTILLLPSRPYQTLTGVGFTAHVDQLELTSYTLGKTLFHGGLHRKSQYLVHQLWLNTRHWKMPRRNSLVK